MGIETVAVYSDADADALHVKSADAAIRIGPAPAAESYLVIDRIIEACTLSGAEAVHPGYGFLSENADFADAVAAAGLTFIGPSADAIRAMGRKDAAKRLMAEAGVPIVPGYHGEAQDPDALAAEAEKIGYPVLIKARAGGGGKGMRRVDAPGDFKAALAGAQREGLASFGDGHCLIEKCIQMPRHIEVQVFGDSQGQVVHLFERDCSLQRRHQKVIEEAPAPGMPATMRAAMGNAAVRAADAIGYTSAGTVEFIADVADGLRDDRFYFMEMNTRLQVEHPVTEFVTGLDLVEWQLRVAAGEPLPKSQSAVSIDGWAMEARVYAEDPAEGFLPATGRVSYFATPAEARDLRIDLGIRAGDDVSPFYDPMLAKVVAHGPDRDSARRRLLSALAACQLAGVTTNLGFLARLADQDAFARGDVDTGLIDRHLDELVLAETAPPHVIGLAALAALGLIAANDGTDPWASLRGWRMWSDAQHHVLLEWNGEHLEIHLVADVHDSFAVTNGGARADIKLLDRGQGARVFFESDGRPTSAGVVQDAQGITVFADGHTYSFALPDRLADADESDAGGDWIVSPLPGLIRQLTARPGATVAQGQQLVLIEAMKMEHGLTAPREGVVAEVLVAEGQQVEDGTVLVKLEPNGAPGV